ncbi:MAG: glycosyltransferase family 2 protein [Spirochaetaceae bacterium]|jgi:dolichol-phosphate mannosyltransferase|nr:glycosyltransferase family 2 protein [Spirochaetaceae bacterium]
MEEQTRNSEWSGMTLLICVPTYNEAENIMPFLDAVFQYAPAAASVLVIDDNSPDGTAAIVQRRIDEHGEKLHLLNRPEKQGLGVAYIAAFYWGIDRSYDAFLEIDADFSHDPAYIPQMFNELQTHDVVIGSRNIKGGSVSGWGPLRHIISKGGSLYAQCILGCPIKDLTGGFNMYRRQTLLRIGLDKIISKGYTFQIEAKYHAWRAGCRIIEIPILFTDRTRGASKMSKKIFIEGLLSVWKIRLSTADTQAARRTVEQAFKFGITGTLGTATNLALFFLCADIFSLPPVPVSIGCFLVTGTQNYFINHIWSFASVMRGAKLSVLRWLKYLASALAGLAVSLAVMYAVLNHWTLPYKVIAQAAGAIAGMFINFTVSKFIVFRSKNENI